MVNSNLVMADLEVGAELPELSLEMTTSKIIMGALASRDWQPQHHDRTFAQERNGTKDIFVNTNHNASMIERYVTDWTGVMGRLGKIKFKMKKSVFPGDTVTFTGKVAAIHDAKDGINWADIAVVMSVGEEVCTQGAIRVAVPTTPAANPWTLSGDGWNPDFQPLGK